MDRDQLLNAISLLGKAVPPVFRPWDIWAWGDGRAGNSGNEMEALQNAYGAARASPAAPKGDRLPIAPQASPQAPQVPQAPAAGMSPGTAADMGWQNFDHRAANMPGMADGLLKLGAQRLAQAQPQAPAPAPQPPPAAPVVAQGDPVGAGVPLPAPRPQAAPSAPAAQPVPMPQPRPAEAPQQAPGMSFWQRNAAMMRDPITGSFLDPAAAQRADATGPELIQKFMNYFNDKA
jgi:hypothetical protein